MRGVVNGQKLCRKCGVWLPVSEFQRNGACLRSWCRPCKCRDNVERYNSRDDQWRQQAREAQRGWYSRLRPAQQQAVLARNQARRSTMGKEERDAFNAYQREWRARTPKYWGTWNDDRRARLAAADGDHTLDEWSELLWFYEGRCAYCGSTDRIEKDHRNPLSRGGTNLIENLTPACIFCNRSKGTQTVKEFRDRIQRRLPVPGDPEPQ